MDKLCLIASPYSVRHTLHHKIHAGDGHAVAQRLISCAVRRAGDICPAIWKALQPLTFQRRKTADEQNGQILVTHQLAGMEYQVSGVLALPGALGTGDLVGGKCIHTLAAEYRVAVEAGQCVGHILLIPHTISTVLRLAVYRIPRKAVNLLPHKRYIVTAGAAACRHGRSHTAHLSIASVHTVALKYQRLVVAHLRPKRGGFIYRHVHTLATLIVDAQDGWHTVSAAAGLQCRCDVLAVTDAARTGSRTGREARHERLHLQIGGRHQRPRRIAQIDALVPLVDMVRLDKPHLRQYYQIDHPQAALHFQRQFQRCRQLLPALPRSTENAQAGFPAQIVFALRMGLQDLPQGRSSYDSGAHPSIELMYSRK